MAAMGPAPKPDGERRNRTPSPFTWTDLPAAGRSGPPPKLPMWRGWQPGTRAWWKDLWSTPQAVAWDQSGRTLWRLAELRDDGIVAEEMAPSRSAEMRQIEDRHGLSPRAMMQLRWRVVDAEERPLSALPAKRAQGRRDRALQVITGGSSDRSSPPA